MLLSIASLKIRRRLQISAVPILVIPIILLLSLDRRLNLLAQVPTMSSGEVPISTPWRPSKKNTTYTGPKACAKCHAEESAKQHLTAMGRALEPVATSEILRANRRMTYRSGPYAHEIVRRGDQSLYTVTDGVNTISEPILYTFGQGKAGQTYIFRHDGAFYESRISFYKDIQGLDVTIGYPRDIPPSLDVAAGRRISMDEARNCFSCHATAAAYGSQLQLDRLIPGVTCEACHGPGADHIAAMESRHFKDKRIFNPGKMDADELSQEFCGSCHRSAEQVISNKLLRGLITVRFQPYRMFTSRAHDPADMRLTCTACHNPHEDPSPEPAYYDAKCFTCHRSFESLKSPALAKTEEREGRIDKACPVARNLCVSCHMPKVEFPGSHFKFTDHRIRIVRTGEQFPG
jgi:cytochrome c554/c'-like protein